MPLQTVSVNILYTNINVRTNYGTCSIKVWVYINNFKIKMYTKMDKFKKKKIEVLDRSSHRMLSHETATKQLKKTCV